jgi:hypothetical protein
MVMLSSANVTAHPIYAEFIQTEASRIPSDVKVWNALLACAGIERKEKEAGVKLATMVPNLALAPGLPPEIVPDWLKFDTARWAEFRPSEPERIFVNTHWIKEFAKNKNFLMKAPRHFILSTVLHGLLHYLDFKLDGEFQDAETVDGKLKFTEGKEQGHAFELRAFGGTKKLRRRRGQQRSLRDAIPQGLVPDPLTLL